MAALTAAAAANTRVAKRVRMWCTAPAEQVRTGLPLQRCQRVIGPAGHGAAGQRRRERRARGPEVLVDGTDPRA